MRKNILRLILVVLVAAVGIGLYLWNKPRPKAENQQGMAIAAETLYQAYSTNETGANTAYLDKVLQVRGTIAEISRNQDGKQVVLLSVEDPLGGVQCTMREEQPSFALQQKVEIKGFCNGFTTVVVLSDCMPVTRSK